MFKERARESYLPLRVSRRARTWPVASFSADDGALDRRLLLGPRVSIKSVSHQWFGSALEAESPSLPWPRSAGEIYFCRAAPMMLALFLAGVMLQGKLMIEMTCLFQYVMLLSSALSVQSSPIFIVVEDVSIGVFFP